MKVNCRLQESRLSLRWGALLPLLLAGLGLMQPAAAQSTFLNSVQHGKAVLHDDGTRTESVKDMNKHEIIETTFDSRGVAITKKTFQVNRNGDPVQGMIHDGAGNMVAKVLFGFDDLGRLMEERCVNTRGEVFRRVIHSYDPAGKRLKPKAFDYKVNAPNMKVAPIDFTKRTGPDSLRPPPRSMAGGGGGTSVGGGAPVQAPGGQPQIMSVSPSGYAQPLNGGAPAGTGQQEAYRQAYEQQQAQQMQQQQATQPPQAQQPQKEKKKGFWPFGKKEK